ncbi:hypothetical protein B0H21DRAFT_182615 [Amylocystis lapponica]|nr:hypothetical protein B0H21DRAFT_182615 [Amylocystis lapponica]
MISTQRAHNPRSPPTSSRPVPVDNYVPVSPPRTPPRGRRPSVSSPMSWLTRSSSSSLPHGGPYAPSKPIRISEPRFANTFDTITSARGGTLGKGAIVVRTPQEALAGPRNIEEQGFSAIEEAEQDEAPPDSPPLPPIPDVEAPVERTASWHSHTPPRPTRPVPALPQGSLSEPTLPAAACLRSSLKTPITPPEDSPPVPSLPANLSHMPPQAPFEPILVSAIPTAAVDPAKTIVSLETSTMTHRTTLKTIMSRPSLLATYFKTLLPEHDSDADSVYSTVSNADSAFNSIFHRHLASSGLLSPGSTSIHIFLDRPSAPYAHILAYLRSPPSTPECPAILPCAAQLSSCSPSRLEALLELRDEALHLDLDELAKLCSDELRQRQSVSGLGLHMRGLSNASGSSRSIHTLREVVELDARADWRDSGFASGAGASPHTSEGPAEPGVQQRFFTRRRSRKEGSGSLRVARAADWI